MTNKIICECGLVVSGKSKKHLKHNLKIHKKAKAHKRIIEFKSKENKK